MADFTDGVKEYIEATALVPVKNYFPVDFRGNPDMSCCLLYTSPSPRDS